MTVVPQTTATASKRQRQRPTQAQAHTDVKAAAIDLDRKLGALTDFAAPTDGDIDDLTDASVAPADPEKVQEWLGEVREEYKGKEAATVAKEDASTAAVTYNSYCGDGSSDAETKCSEARRCSFPEDCAALSAAEGVQLGCFANIPCESTASSTSTGTGGPTASPVAAPTTNIAVPTAAPVAAPVADPTAAPIVAVTSSPTSSPVVVAAVTADPTVAPVAAPTAAPVAVGVDAAPPVAEPTAAPASGEESATIPAVLEPTAAPIVPSTAAPVIPEEEVVEPTTTMMATEPTAMPAAATVGDKDIAMVEPTAAPAIAEEEGSQDVIETIEGETATPTNDTVTITEAATEPTAAPVVAEPTTATTTTSPAPTPTPAPIAPVTVTKETDSDGNPTLYSCADAIAPLVDPETGATAPSWSSMEVEFDYEMYWNDPTALVATDTTTTTTTTADGNDVTSGTEPTWEPTAEPTTGVPELTIIDGDPEEAIDQCEADCDDNDQCVGDLVCYQRDDDEEVPGCTGEAQSGWDYCVDPSDLERSRNRDRDRDRDRNLADSDLEASIASISGKYLTELADEYELSGEDCSAFMERRTMLRRALLRKLQDDTTVVEISDGGDVVDDVECVTNPPTDYPSATCVPIKGKVGVKYTGTDEASIRKSIMLSSKSYVESLPADVSGKFAGINFVGLRDDGGAEAGRDNLNPFPGVNPGVAAANAQLEAEDKSWWNTSHSPLGIAFIIGLAVAFLLVGLLLGRSVRNKRRMNRAIKKETESRKSISMAEEGSFSAAASMKSESRIGIGRRSENEQDSHIMVSPATATSSDMDFSGEFNGVEIELNPSDLNEDYDAKKKRFRGRGIFRTRSRSKSPGSRRSKSPVDKMRNSRSLADDGPGASDDGGARSILKDLSQSENSIGRDIDETMMAELPMNRSSTNASVEACLDYYNYDDALVDTRGRSVTPTRSLMDEDEDIYGIVNLD